MPSVAAILVQEILASLKPAVEDAVQRALGTTPTGPVATGVAPPRSMPTKRGRKAAKTGVYIVATSRGRLPDWLKAAAKVDKSTEVTARWPKGTELLKGAPLPPFSAQWQRKLAPKSSAPKGRKKVAAKKAAPAVEAPVTA